MTRDRNEELSTADLAAATDARGRGDERVVARGDDPPRTVETHEPRPAPAARPVEPGPARQEIAAHALFPGDEANTFRERWVEVQGAFVDEPRKAVERADALVAEVMKRMAEVFARERTGLEQQWDRGDRVTTEDLRIALQRYRTFFDRLLSV
jgi:hypothetical protein